MHYAPPPPPLLRVGEGWGGRLHTHRFEFIGDDSVLVLPVFASDRVFRVTENLTELCVVGSGHYQYYNVDNCDDNNDIYILIVFI